MYHWSFSYLLFVSWNTKGRSNSLPIHNFITPYNRKSYQMICMTLTKCNYPQCKVTRLQLPAVRPAKTMRFLYGGWTIHSRAMLYAQHSIHCGNEEPVVLFLHAKFWLQSIYSEPFYNNFPKLLDWTFVRLTAETED